jgi:hypothetical protein
MGAGEMGVGAIGRRVSASALRSALDRTRGVIAGDMVTS